MRKVHLRYKNTTHTTGQVCRVQLSTSANIPLGIRVGSGDHLREVNDCWTVVGVQENVELVEVAVDETKASQLDYELHQNTVERGGVCYVVDLTAGRGKRERERER